MCGSHEPTANTRQRLYTVRRNLHRLITGAPFGGHEHCEYCSKLLQITSYQQRDISHNGALLPKAKATKGSAINKGAS